MSRFEIAWRAWLSLNPGEKAKFCSLYREWYRVRRETAVAARTPNAPAPASPFDRVKADQLDYDNMRLW